jgi:hypothetical protein
MAVLAGLAMLSILAWRAREWRIRQLAPFSPLAKAYLERAAAADSVGLLALSTDAEPVHRILAMQRIAPEQLATVRRTLQLRGGAIDSAHALVEYRTEATICPPYLEERGMFHFEFILVDDAWLVNLAAPPPC